MDATVLLGTLAALLALLFILRQAREAMRSGDLKKLLAGPPAAGIAPAGAAEEENPDHANDPASALAADHRRLTDYLSLASQQAQTGLRFSLAFAGLGFILLVAAAFFPIANPGGSALVQILAGMALVGASGLLFNSVRSTHSGICKSLEKLNKRDRHLKSRELCDNVGDEKTRDALKVQLALHYAGVSRPLETARAITRIPQAGN